MKIYRRAAFLALPAGTIYAKGKPWCFEDLSVKGETWMNDFLTMGLVWIESGGSTETVDRLEEMIDSGASYPMETDGFGRDGCFDNDDLFLVYEKADLEALRGFIDRALSIG